jgi:hypothetical protein
MFPYESPARIPQERSGDGGTLLEARYRGPGSSGTLPTDAYLWLFLFGKKF